MTWKHFRYFQRRAEAVFTDEGYAQINDNISYYLASANVAAIPGAGFGKNGEGFLRLSAFGEKENIIKAIGRIMNISK